MRTEPGYVCTMYNFIVLGTPVALSNSTLANAVYKLPGTSGHMVLAGK